MIRKSDAPAAATISSRFSGSNRSSMDTLRALGGIMEEAPYAYKPVEPVVDSVEDAGVARKVARLFPLCTVKG